MKLKPEHLSGISFDSVRTDSVRFSRGDEPSTGGDWETVLPELELTISSAANADAGAYSVTLTASFGGPFGWELAVGVTGLFSVPLGSDTSVDMTEFVRIQGVAILLPFLRSTVASISTDPVMGSLLLPPINVLSLVRNPDEADPAD